MLRKTAVSLGRVIASVENSVWNEAGSVAGFATRVASVKSSTKKAPPPKSKKESSAASAAKAPTTKPPAGEKGAKGKEKAPKRPMTAYALFVKNEYPGIKEASPGKPFAEISRKLADLWKELPDDRRTKYMKEAEKSVAAAKTTKLPKAPPTAYAVFAKEMFKNVKDKHPSLEFADVARKVAQLWKNLPPLEKAARKDRYMKLKEEFDKKNPKKATMKA